MVQLIENLINKIILNLLHFNSTMVQLIAGAMEYLNEDF